MTERRDQTNPGGGLSEQDSNLRSGNVSNEQSDDLNDTLETSGDVEEDDELLEDADYEETEEDEEDEEKE